MNKKLTIGIAVAVVVIAGLAWWAMGRAPSTGLGNQVAGTSSAMSMKALLASGAPQKCTFQFSTSTISESGTVYVASGHMRGDFNSQISEGKTVQSHMITDGTTSWVWTDQAAQGMKMSFTATSSAQAQGSAQRGNSVDPNVEMNYSCSGWTPDQNEFTLPASITFSDLSQMMNNIGVGAGAHAGAGAGAKVNGSAAMCAQCNQITNANSKASCLAALGCAQ